MKTMLPISLLCALALSGCATGSAARPPLECPKPQPIPEALLKPAAVDFSQRMRAWCCESAPMPTELPGNSTR